MQFNLTPPSHLTLTHLTLHTLFDPCMSDKISPISLQGSTKNYSHRNLDGHLHPPPSQIPFNPPNSNHALRQKPQQALQEQARRQGRQSPERGAKVLRRWPPVQNRED